MLPGFDIESEAILGITGMRQTATHCPYCSLQCGMNLQSVLGGHGDKQWTVAERDFPTNRGGLCQKGWTAAELLAEPSRLRQPLVRDRPGGSL